MATPQINIMTMIDVIGSLSDGKLQGNIYMMDNSRSSHTTGQGTGGLGSVVQFGQVINWHILPIDVQTDVRITKVIWVGENPCLKLQKYGLPGDMPPYYAGIVGLDVDNPQDYAGIVSLEVDNPQYYAGIVGRDVDNAIQDVSEKSDYVKGGIYHYNLEILMSNKKTMVMTTNPFLNIRHPGWAKSGNNLMRSK